MNAEVCYARIHKLAKSILSMFDKPVVPWVISIVQQSQMRSHGDQIAVDKKAQVNARAR